MDRSFVCLFLIVCITTCVLLKVDAYQCGPQSYFTQNNGEIKSHGGYDIGHHYGKDLNCSWSIAAPVGFVVELVAENFTLEYGFSNCNYVDYLELFDGNSTNARSLGKFCGTTFNPITSTGRFLTLHFVTNSRSGYDGFKIFYNFTEDIIRVCPGGGFMCNNSHCIRSSYWCDTEDDCGDNSDEQNCPEKTCSPGYFQCANKNCVSRGWVCDGDNDCGDRSDEAFSACSHRTTTSRYFIPWSHCGQLNFSGGSGEIHSPNYPLYYPGSSHCHYDIYGPAGTKTINIHFNSTFQLEADYACSYDYVKVYAEGHLYPHVVDYASVVLDACFEQDSQTLQKIQHEAIHLVTGFTRSASLETCTKNVDGQLYHKTGPFCGSLTPAPFSVPSNHVIVEFNSDISDNYEGFMLTWKALS